MLNLMELKQDLDLVWLDGQEIKVKEPTFGMMKQFMDYFESDANVEAMIPLLITLLNNNENNREFTEKDLEDLTVTQMGAVVKFFVDYVDSVDTDPK